MPKEFGSVLRSLYYVLHRGFEPRLPVWQLDTFWGHFGRWDQNIQIEVRENPVNGGTKGRVEHSALYSQPCQHCKRQVSTGFTETLLVTSRPTRHTVGRTTSIRSGHTDRYIDLVRSIPTAILSWPPAFRIPKIVGSIPGLVFYIFYII